MAAFPTRWARTPEMALEWLILGILMREGSELNWLFEI